MQDKTIYISMFMSGILETLMENIVVIICFIFTTGVFYSTTKNDADSFKEYIKNNNVVIEQTHNRLNDLQYRSTSWDLTKQSVENIQKNNESLRARIDQLDKQTTEVYTTLKYIKESVDDIKTKLK